MRILKKTLAAVVAVAMVFGIVNIGVFAADEQVSLAVTTNVEQVGQGKTIVVSINATGKDVSVGGAGVTLKFDNTKFSIPNDTSDFGEFAASTSYVSQDDGEIVMQNMSLNKTLSATSQVLASFTFSVKSDAAIGNAEFTLSDYDGGWAEPSYAPLTVAATGATVNILKAFTVATVDAVADQTAELGDKVADVKAKLANLDVTVKGSAADETATLKATWDCAELADAETITTAKDYTFTGTLQGTDVVTVPEGKTATVKVTVGKIALADAMVTSTYKNIEIPQTETAATLTAEQVIAQYVGDEYKVATISKNGTFEEKDATVAWAGTGSIDTSLLTSENAGNKLTLTGTVTPKTEGSNYTGTARTADITVTVVPAEISGGAISINNPIDNGYVTANITVPASVIAKMPLDAEGDSDEVKAEKKAKRTISLIVPNAD